MTIKKETKEAWMYIIVMMGIAMWLIGIEGNEMILIGIFGVSYYAILIQPPRFRRPRKRMEKK